MPSFKIPPCSNSSVTCHTCGAKPFGHCEYPKDDPTDTQCYYEEDPDRAWCGSLLCAEQGCVSKGTVRGSGTGASGKVPPPVEEGRPDIPMFPGDRHDYPIMTGLLAYFPDACAEVARCSKMANDQHNAGLHMHWARGKSIGSGDQLVRHLMEAGNLDVDGIPHTAKAAWRALELLQREIEAGVYDRSQR